jgi:hypothetical protein
VDDDALCRGPALPPLGANAAIGQAARTFFSARFDAGLASGKSRALPDNILEQWRALHRAGAQSYPADDLLLSADSLGDMA